MPVTFCALFSLAVSIKQVFPLRWTAVESLQTLKFSQASDVWAFAILMVEIYQFGAIPYKDFKNEKVIIEVGCTCLPLVLRGMFFSFKLVCSRDAANDH